MYKYFIIALLLVGCRTILPPEVVTVTKDTTITIPPDSAWLEALIECDSMNKAHIREIVNYNSGVNIQVPNVVIRDRTLYVKCKSDTIFRTVVATRKASVYVKITNELTWIQELFYFLGIAWSGLFVAFVVFLIIKSKL